MAVKPLFLGAENLELSPLLGHHACPIVLVVGLLLKEHVVDEESRSNEGGLATYVEVHGERDPKVISVSEGLLEESCPLLGDPPHLMRLVWRHYLELDVASTGVGAPGAEDLQGHVAVTIRDLKFGFDASPALVDKANGVTRWRLNLD